MQKLGRWLAHLHPSSGTFEEIPLSTWHNGDKHGANATHAPRSTQWRVEEQSKAGSHNLQT